jgi:hypothetical protein
MWAGLAAEIAFLPLFRKVLHFEDIALKLFLMLEPILEGMDVTLLIALWNLFLAFWTAE